AVKMVVHYPETSLRKQHMARVHSLVRRTDDLGFDRVEFFTADPSNDACMRSAELRLSMAVRGLVETVDRHRVVRGGALEHMPPRRVGVRVATGIDNQRSPIAEQFHRQLVVVAVAAVA